MWVNGSLAEINVESLACGARSKTTIVRKPQWSKLFLNTNSPSAKPADPKKQKNPVWLNRTGFFVSWE